MKTEVFCLFCAALLSLSPGLAAEIRVRLESAGGNRCCLPKGDTLLVSAGTYDRITISKSINLIGSGAVIRAGSRDACVSIEADNVNMSGFLVRDGFYGIKLNYVKGCTIANNTVIYCAQPGIALLFSDGNTITGNNLSFNGIVGEGWYGIYLSNSNDNLIAGNSACGNESLRNQPLSRLQEQHHQGQCAAGKYVRPLHVQWLHRKPDPEQRPIPQYQYRHIDLRIKCGQPNTQQQRGG